MVIICVFNYLFTIFRLLGRLIFAISALSRGNTPNIIQFHTLGCFKILPKIVEHRKNDLNILLKSLNLMSDLIRNIKESEENNVNENIMDSQWCQLLKTEKLYEEQNLDHTERLVQSLSVLSSKCDAKNIGKEHALKK